MYVHTLSHTVSMQCHFVPRNVQLKCQKIQKVEFANSIASDEIAHGTLCKHNTIFTPL